MPQSFKRKAIWWLVWFSMPFLVAWAGPRFFPGFDIRGPFLAVSPLIALTVFGLVFSRKTRPMRSTSVSNECLDRLSSELGLPELKIKRWEAGEKVHFRISDASGQNVGLPSDWETLGDFALIYAVTDFIERRRPIHSLGSAWKLLSLALGLAISGINLWFILAVHLFWAIQAIVMLKWWGGWFALARDRRALAISRDLDAAIAYVRKVRVLERLLSTELRVQNLRREAARLGIA